MAIIIDNFNIINIINNKANLNYFFSKNSFILNLGTNIHIYYNKIVFNKLLPINKKITWANISKIKVSKIKNIPIYFKNIKQKILLNNILFIFKFNLNILFLNILINKNYNIIFKNKLYSIFNIRIIIINYNNIWNLYLLNIDFFNKNYKIIEIIFNILKNKILNNLL